MTSGNRGHFYFVWYDEIMKKLVIDCVGYSIDADWYENGNQKVLLVLHGWNSNKKSQEALTSFLVIKQRLPR